MCVNHGYRGHTFGPFLTPREGLNRSISRFWIVLGNSGIWQFSQNLFIFLGDHETWQTGTWQVLVHPPPPPPPPQVIPEVLSSACKPWPLWSIFQGLLSPQRAKIGWNAGFHQFCKNFPWIYITFTFQTHWNYFQKCVEFGPPGPIRHKRPTGAKFVQGIYWLLLGRFSLFESYVPFGPRYTLAWSFPLGVQVGLKSAHWAKILSVIRYLSANTGLSLMLIISKGHVKALQLQMRAGLICW